MDLRIFLNKNYKKTSTVSCFCLTKQKGSVVPILLALQNNSTGSVLTNDGTLAAGTRCCRTNSQKLSCDCCYPSHTVWGEVLEHSANSIAASKALLMMETNLIQTRKNPIDHWGGVNQKFCFGSLIFLVEQHKTPKNRI